MNPYTPAGKYPFYVTALKNSHLMTLNKGDMANVLDVFGDAAAMPVYSARPSKRAIRPTNSARRHRESSASASPRPPLDGKMTGRALAIGPASARRPSSSPPAPRAGVRMAQRPVSSQIFTRPVAVEASSIAAVLALSGHAPMA